MKMEEKEASTVKKAGAKAEKPTTNVKAAAKPRVAPKAKPASETEVKPKAEARSAAAIKPKIEKPAKAEVRIKAEKPVAARAVKKVTPEDGLKPKAEPKVRTEVKLKSAPRVKAEKPAAVIKPKATPAETAPKAKVDKGEKPAKAAVRSRTAPKAEVEPKSERSPVIKKVKPAAGTELKPEAVEQEAESARRESPAESAPSILQPAQVEKTDGQAEVKRPRTPGEHKKMPRPQKIYDYSSQASVPSEHGKPELLFPLTVKKHAKTPKKPRKDTGRNLRKSTVGIVTSNKMDKTIVVEIVNTVKHPLYKKRIKQTQRFKAHDEKNECGVGDRVEIAETRKISRDKYWRLVAILEKAK
jgi:small subunit ribosomal protein S17